MNRSIPVALAAAASFAIAGQAAAHAHLVSSDPAVGGTVSAPKSITLHMSEVLEPRFSGLELSKDGAPVVVKVAVPAGDKKAIVAEPAAPLAPGAYKVAWHAVAADGHASKGAYTFTVR